MGDLEVGLMSLGDLLPHPATGHLVTEAERHRSLVDQAILAESLGFTAVHLGEHHFSDYMLSSPPVVLAAIGERTTSLRLSTAVTLAGNLDPVRVAEDYATVDALSGGRAEIVTGRGNLFTRTYDGFGHSVDDARHRYDESVALLNRLLREEDVHWSGRFRPDLTGHTTRPRPTGELPLWVGAGSAASATLAAELGAALMLPTVIGSPELFRPIVDSYRQRWSDLGRPDGRATVGACSHTHVTTGDVSEWARYYGNYWSFVGRLIGGERWVPFDFDTLLAGPAVAGSPQQVVERIEQWRTTLTLDRHLFMFDLGGMEPQQVLDVIGLFGAEVVPKLS